MCILSTHFDSWSMHSSNKQPFLYFVHTWWSLFLTPNPSFSLIIWKQNQLENLLLGFPIPDVENCHLPIWGGPHFDLPKLGCYFFNSGNLSSVGLRLFLLLLWIPVSLRPATAGEHSLKRSILLSSSLFLLLSHIW